MKRCSHDGCGRKITSDSVSGLCFVHYGELRFAKAKPVRVCGACKRNALSPNNQSGLCLECYNRQRAVHVPKCEDCGARIGHGSRTGLCANCYCIRQDANARRCSHEGCDRRITNENKSGLCLGHRRNVRNAKPTEAVRILAKEVADALGVSPRDILGRSQEPAIVEARAVVAAKLRERGLSWPRIGLRLGRDHSSVLNLARRLPVYAERNPRVAAFLERAA